MPTDRLRRSLTSLAATFVVLGALALALGSASASAEPPLPVFSGLMDFPKIGDASAAEEYSWKVELHGGQELQAIDDQHAGVFFEDGTQMFGIVAEAAHDADGDTVPTSLVVSGDDEVTLIVHHRAGDPAAGGAPFDYPIWPGPGFEVGYSTVIVHGPPDEMEEREAREAREREARERALAPAPAITASMAVERSGWDRRAGSVTLAIASPGRER